MEELERNSPRKRTPRVLVSLTAKIQPESLSQSLAKSRLARRLSHLYDPSVPKDVRFDGILPPENATNARPNVRSGGRAPLSPYVVYLSSPSLPSPHEMLDDGRTLRLNLLHGRPLELLEILSEDSLSLSGDDVASQLAEDLTPRRLTIRARPEFSKPTVDPVAPMTDEGFDLVSLHPAMAPENFSDYFELPEAEQAGGDEDEEDESDGVILEIQGGQFEMTTLEPAPRASRLPHGWKPAILVFAALALVFVLPLHTLGVASRLREARAAVAGASGAALASLHGGAAAALAQEPEQAREDFASAGASFADAERSLEGLGVGLRLLGGDIADLTQAGQAVSRAAERVSDGFVALQGQVNPTPTDRLTLLATYFESALPHLEDAVSSLERVNANVIPEEHRAEVLALKNDLPPLVSQFTELLGFARMADTVLGGDGIKRYLVVFQNNTELRATGGFMGSFAEIELVDGQIARLNIPGGGTYDLRAGLSTYTAAPEPMRLLSARWEFQDLNWFPDFPTTARTLLEYYGDAGGVTVDGVIAVNATLMPRVLKALGPVEMPGYGRTITAENFLGEAQKIVEIEYDRVENKPKAFIGDLAQALLARVTELPAEEFPALLDLVNEALVDRNVQIYFADGELEKRVRELGWGGEIKWTDGDYQMIVDTNLGGGKTDGVIEQTVDVNVDIAADGTVTDTVRITRTHYGVPGALFTGVNNVDYLRLYVPKGSELISASGFKIPDPSLFEKAEADWHEDPELAYEAATATTHAGSGTRVSEESGKTVFGNWVQTKPGTSSTVTFSYRLPFKVGAPKDEGFMETLKRFAGIPSTERYSLIIQKQSGVLKRTTNVTVHTPGGLDTLWSSHELEGASFENDTDAALSALFERKD